MKRILPGLLIAAAVSCSNQSVAQPIEFPYDTAAITIDGHLAVNEWRYAHSIKIGISSADSILVLYKHDMNVMYFAYAGKLESSNALFPEVLVDPQNAKSSAWTSDQWWLHVSATDCENKGGYGVYSNCAVTQPGWEGGPNFTSGAPYTDTVEIKIPFSKTGFDIVTQDSMGIALLVTNTFSIFRLFPYTANRNIPSTWTTATFSKVLAETLPVRLTFFKATCENNKVVLKWQTAAESNSKEFIIERSTDGKNFQIIATVKASGNSTIVNNYSYTDIDENRLVHYRLKQVDKDGRSNYSGVITSTCKGSGSNIQLYPNPATDKLHITIPGKENATVTILNAGGNTVLEKKKIKPLACAVDISRLIAGTYLVQVENDDQLYTAAFIKL